MRKASILLVPCLIGGALLVGCGGGDDSSSTEAALSKSAYIKQANAICKKAADEINTAGSQQFGNRKPTEAEISKFVNDTAVPAFDDELSQLRDLPPPSGDEDTVNAIYDAAQDGADALKEDPSILLTDNPAAFQEANKLAKDYGLNVCAS